MIEFAEAFLKNFDNNFRDENEILKSDYRCK